MNTSCSDIQLSEHIVCSGTCLSAPMDADKFLQEHTVWANKAELILHSWVKTCNRFKWV